MRQQSIFYSQTEDRCLEFGNKWRHKGTRMDSGLRSMAPNQCGATNTWRGRSQKDENGYGWLHQSWVRRALSQRRGEFGPDGRVTAL